MKIFSLVFSIIVIVLGVTFAVLNTTPVTLNFVAFVTGKVPLSLAIVLAFALGALFGILVSMAVIFRLKRNAGKLERQLESTLQTGKDYTRV